MERWISLLGVLAVFFAPVLPFDAPSAAPALVIDPPSIDLGLLEGDITVPFGFTLRNDGDAPLRIDAVDPTCGCTVIFLSDSLLEPGESVPLTGAFSSRKLEGEIHKMLIVETNDPARPRAIASLLGWVQRELTLSDPIIDFGEFDPDESKEAQIRMRAAKGALFEILGVEGPAERFQFWTETGASPGEYVLHVTLLPQPEGTVLRDTISVRTNVERHETVRLPVHGRVREKRR